MASQERIREAYLRYKSMGLKRSCNDWLAEAFNVSRQTLYKWSKKPITINGTEYENWEAAYNAETLESRKNYESEIENQLKDGWKLLDVIQNEMLMRYAVLVKQDDYKPTLEEIEKITKLSELVHNRVDGVNGTKSDKQDVQFSFKFIGKDQ